MFGSVSNDVLRNVFGDVFVTVFVTVFCAVYADTMMTREELRESARALGRASAKVGDTYDVVEAFAAGYSEANSEFFSDKDRDIHYELSALNSLQSAAEEVIQWRVEDARKAFMSWDKIAEALDITPQSARRKYGTAEDQIEPS